MDLQLRNKHVFITGGSKGIGFACAQEFLAEGCSVTLIGRDPARLDEACIKLRASGGTVNAVSADLSDSAEAAAAIDKAEASLGPVDILVNAAGGARQKPFAELQPQDWRTAMDAKFFTYINVMDPMVKRMAMRGGGAVINIVGMGGKLPITTHLVGGAANAALLLASAGLAMAYAPKGVRVNALNPSKTATDRFMEGVQADARQHGITTEQALAKAHASIPIGRLASAEDIAAAVVFLASPRAGYISGAVLSMDGAARPMIV
jgi:NAD(P)-dependent dehydrogenase (short-subunit alcohol dehydrogenase family)